MDDLKTGANGVLWLRESMLYDVPESGSFGFCLENQKFWQFIGGGVLGKGLDEFLPNISIGFAVKSMAFNLGGQDVLHFICNGGGDSSWGGIAS